MASFFDKLKGEEKGRAGKNAASSQPMDLAERQAFRRELLYQAIREGMMSLEVSSSRYKFKIMNLDKRHHHFIVMIDVTKSFQPRQYGKLLSFYDIEAFIKNHTFDRFGLRLEGIYWRVSDSESPFHRDIREGDSPETAAAILDSTRQREEAGETPSERQRLARHPDKLISEVEKKAFLEAIRKGVKAPVIHVGDREYHSDLAPFDDGSKRK
jgi:hypothetical protein